MPAVRAFDEALLQRVCDVLGDTDAGLTGTEIGRLPILSRPPCRAYPKLAVDNRPLLVQNVI